MNIAHARCNLLRDGVERSARHIHKSTRNSRGVMAWVVRNDGSIRGYRRGDVTEQDEPHLLGTYNARISESTLAEDLQLRLAELGETTTR